MPKIKNTAGSHGRSCCLKATCCLIVTAIIVIGIIAAVLASTFKVPDVQFGSLQQGTEQPQISLAEVKAQFLADGTVTNPNSYTIELTSVKVRGALAAVPDTQIADGHYDNLKLPGDNAVTPFSIPIEFHWTQDSDPGNKILGEFVKACRTGGSKLSIVYKLDVWAKLNGIGPFPIPTISRTSDQNCPADFSSLLSIAGIAGIFQ